MNKFLDEQGLKKVLAIVDKLIEAEAARAKAAEATNAKAIAALAAKIK